MSQPDRPGPAALATLNLDGLTYKLALPLNVERLSQALAAAMRDGGTLEVTILVEGRHVQAVVRPSNARIAYIDVPLTFRPGTIDPG
jgi:hypothetical protein